MKIFVAYEIEDAKKGIHEHGEVEIPVKNCVEINDDTVSSIKRFILGAVGVRNSLYIIGDPTIKELKIIK